MDVQYRKRERKIKHACKFTSYNLCKSILATDHRLVYLNMNLKIRPINRHQIRLSALFGPISFDTPMRISA